MKLFFLSMLFFTYNVTGYYLPRIGIGLGANNFLNGGPLRPKAGWYYAEFFYYYTTHTFLNGQGQLLGNIPSPKFHAFSGMSEILYQTHLKILHKGSLGFKVALPYIFYSHIEKNLLGITDSGKGFEDLSPGIYIQWQTIKRRERPIFQHRVQFDFTFPTGKVKTNATASVINPGTNVFFITPYWAATLFFTPEFTTSWRLTYLWSGTNPDTHITPGDAIVLDYNALYECKKNFYIGLNGYFLQQLKNTKLNGQDIPDSKERVFAVGPGLLYTFPHRVLFFAHLYKESKVRNRTKGTTITLCFLKIF